MMAIVVAALIGGPMTAFLLWDKGAVVALLCAPLGGSACGLAVAVLLALLRTRFVWIPHRGWRWRSNADPRHETS